MELKAKMRLGSGYLFWQKFQKMGFPIQQPVVFLPWWKHASAFQGQSWGGGGEGGEKEALIDQKFTLLPTKMAGRSSVPH